MKQVPSFLYFTGTLFLSYLATVAPTVAQIVPDATLPVNSSVTTSGNNYIINGGTTAGSNLFHSFQEFSIPTGFEALLNNSVDVQNILTRVTGGKISQIDGLMRANGTANLFLLNPAGIIFGPNAALNIGGAFIGSTAESLKFSDGSFLSYTNPLAPPLLAVNVPIGLQMGTNPGPIVVQGSGHNLSLDLETGGTIRNNRPVGLQVPNGQTLALVGGDITLEGGNLSAFLGRIELGSVGPGSFVTIIPSPPPLTGGVGGNGIALDYSGVQNFQDISLSKAASADASGEGAGNIQVVSRRLLLTDGSTILADTLGTLPGGEVSIRTSELVELTGAAPESFYPSILSASVQAGGRVDGGNLTIETARLRLADGAQVQAATFGNANSGNLTVRTTEELEAIGSSLFIPSFPTALSSSVLPGATGDGGNVTIETRRLRLVDGAQIQAITSGTGKAGNLTVRASELVELIGGSPNNNYLFVSGLYTSVQPGAIGDGGNLTVETPRLRLVDGGQIQAITSGTGNAGNLTVRATDLVEIIGTTPITAEIFSTSALATSVQPGAIGDGGNLTVETPRLRLVDGGQILSATFGTGNAGNLTVRATDLVEIIGTVPITAEIFSTSALATSVNSGAIGDGGNLTVETPRLRLVDGGQIVASTFGTGNAGNLTVRATDLVEIIGTTPITAEIFTSSGLFTTIQPGAIGEGGNLLVETPRLRLVDGGAVSTETLGSGKAGNLTVRATETVEVIGISAKSAVTNEVLPSELSVFSESDFPAGNLAVETGSLVVQDGARINLSGSAGGGAGNLSVNADNILIANKGSLTGVTKAGEGNINLFAPSIILRGNSNITTDATGSEITGGNIGMDTDVLVALENSDITANSAEFRGGRVNINANGVFGTTFRFQPTDSSDITATGADSALNGTVTINTPDVDPAAGLVELASGFEDPTSQIGASCRMLSVGNSFVVTGNGGLPDDPMQSFLSGWVIWRDRRLVPNANPHPSSGELRRGAIQRGSGDLSFSSPRSPILEATGLSVNAKGEVELVANVNNLTAQTAWYRQPGCGNQSSNS